MHRIYIEWINIYDKSSVNFHFVQKGEKCLSDSYTDINSKKNHNSYEVANQIVNIRGKMSNRSYSIILLQAMFHTYGVNILHYAWH